MFTAYLEYQARRKAAAENSGSTVAGPTKLLTLKGVRSGDATFDLGKLPAGEYEVRLWAVDKARRESHRVFHKFRVVDAAAVAERPPYQMTAADLGKYGIRNDGDLGREALVEAGPVPEKEKLKEGFERSLRAIDAYVKAHPAGKGAARPGYTVYKSAVNGVVEFHGWRRSRVVLDAGYDTNAVERAAVATAEGLQKFLDEKAAAGVRKVVLLPGCYRISGYATVRVPTNFTLDLNGATIKVNAFTGPHGSAVGLYGCTDSHLVNGTIEGDYWEHDYEHSSNGSEWPLGFCMKGCEYTTVENVTVRDVTGYGVSVGGIGFGPKKYSAIYENLKGWTAGGLDPRTGEVAFNDGVQFTSDFVDIAPYRGEKRLQISKYLGYQGRDTRSWQLVVAWYDAERKFLAGETCWQYREMMIPANAAFLRCSIEAGDLAEAKKARLRLLRFRPSWNCAIRNCTVERARCVGMAPTAMKNMLFEGNLITRSGESKARCAFDAEDGWDQMQDVYFLRNTLKDNPVNNSLLTCCGHNFIFEKTVGGISLHGRTHSSCVRDNDLSYARFCCDSRLRSGYARFSDNRYTGKLSFGNDAKVRGWDFVLSGLTFDKSTARNLTVDAGETGRFVDCTFADIAVRPANLLACKLTNCTIDRLPRSTWTGVRMTGGSVAGVYTTCAFRDCTFDGVRFSNFAALKEDACRAAFTGCAFRKGSLTGFGRGTLAFEKCRFADFPIASVYWQMPGALRFAGCEIETPAAKPFLTSAVYATGDLAFDKCRVTGASPLVLIGDQRANARNPDDAAEPGFISVSNTTYAAKAPFAVVRSESKLGSKKKLVLKETGNTFANGARFVDAARLPSTWTDGRGNR